LGYKEERMRKTATIVALFAAAIIPAAHGAKASAQDVNQHIAPKPLVVTVQPGDSLSKIATANNSTYKRIYNANMQIKDPDLIYPGDGLRIPAQDEQLADRPLPVDVPAPAPVAPKATTSTKVTPTYKKRSIAPQPAAVVTPSNGSTWDRLAQCESGGRWNINTGNGFYGGLQFTASSWHAVGGSGLPNSASREEQIMRAEMLKARQGWGAWPACSVKLGLR
jgi:hypothetical protein